MNFKILLKLIIIIPFISSLSFAKLDLKAHNSYLYSSSYEGFAGYCAVITDELIDVSQKMRKRLNITTIPKSISEARFSSKKQENSTQKQTNFQNNQSFSNFVDTVNIKNNQEQTSFTSPKGINFSHIVSQVSNESNI